MPVPAPYNDRLSFDRSLDTYIEFPTCSDAMLASLGLAHGVDSKVMDAIFAIVHNARFNPKELTLRGTEDVYLHVAKRRCRETTLLTRRGFSDAARALLPTPVLEGVVDVLSDELEASGATIWYGKDAKQTDALKKDLLNMSLVQRSWLQPVRRALGRNLELVNPSRETLLRSLRQPLVGPWTRHLSVTALEGVELTDLVKPLQKLLSSRLTSVYSFSLTVRRRDAAAFVAILPLLPYVRNLKLEICSKGSGTASDVCLPLPTARIVSALASLPCLVHLSLKLAKWSLATVSSDALPTEFAGLARAPHLQAVHLYGHTPCTRLSWTRNEPDESFHLTTLEKDLVRSERLSRDSPLEIPFFTHLSDLRLRVSASSAPLLPCFLPFSRSLQHLYLSTPSFPPPTTFSSLPSSLTHLALHFTFDLSQHPSSPLAELDARLHAHLSNPGTRNLQTLRVSMRTENDGHLVHTDKGYRFRELVEVRMLRSEALCAERGIEWSFRKQMDGKHGLRLD